MQLWPPRQLQLCAEAQRRGRRVVKRLENNIHTDTHAHTHTHLFFWGGKTLNLSARLHGRDREGPWMRMYQPHDFLHFPPQALVGWQATIQHVPVALE